MTRTTKNRKLTSLLFGLAVSMIVALLVLTGNVVSAAEKKFTPEPTLYELGSDTAYIFEGQSTTSSFSYGRKTMGTFSISGPINDANASFKGIKAYGVEDVIQFNYSYDGAFQTDNPDNWNLASDSTNSVNGIKTGGSIAKGVIIVQTSPDNSTWVNAVNPVADFFGTNHSGKNAFYTTAGQDIKDGKYYRIIVAYKMAKRTKDNPGVIDWVIKDKYEYKLCVEVYQFYVCINTAQISVHNLSTNVDELELDGFTIDQLIAGETLLNNSITNTGFSIDKLKTSYVVSVSRNNETPVNASDGQKFTQDGEYTITATTKLGKTSSMKVIVFSGGSDKGLRVYFGDYVVDGNRVARYDNYPELTKYPTYASGAKISLKATNDETPTLFGYFVNITTGERTEVKASHSSQSFELSVGEYMGEFCNAPKDYAGSGYSYSFKFSVLDEKSGPYINYYNLMHASRFEDLQTKHYEVSYQTAGGGYVFVCFALDDYFSAMNYSYEIEKRFIERSDDGLYYKSKENPNKKVKYLDYIELTSALYYYAEKNVEVAYFNSTDPFTYNTYGDEMLENIESLSLRESIKVFSSAEAKEKLTAPQPFVNNFAFIQIGDYDVISVDALCKKNGRIYPISFDQDISNQLTISSIYTITEKNIYGDIRSYDVYYAAENTSILELDISYNGNVERKKYSSSDMTNGSVSIRADSVKIVNAENILDTHSLIAIKAPDVYSFEIKCLLSEAIGLQLYRKGVYEISVIDRIGNTYKLLVSVTGKTRYSELGVDSQTFTDTYNSIFVFDKPLTEERFLDVSKLKTALSQTVKPDYYTTDSFQSYSSAFENANSVFNNVDSTQDDIDKAAVRLTDAYFSLAPTTSRAELDVELTRYEITDKALYTQETSREWTLAYEDALSVSVKSTSTENEIRQALQEIKAAFSRLIRRGDKKQLAEVLYRIKQIDCAKYTPDSIEVLNQAFIQAYNVYSNYNATQDQVNNALTVLERMEQEINETADYSKLQSAILSVKAVNAQLYTDQTISALKVAFGNAVQVLNNKNSSQESVDQATEALINAKGSLKKIIDKTRLSDIISKVASLDYYLYENSIIERLHTAFLEGCQLLSSSECTQEQIDTITNMLTNEFGKLNVDTPRNTLLSYIRNIESLNGTKVKKKKAELISDWYSKATRLLYNSSTDPTQINECLDEYKDLMGD